MPDYSQHYRFRNELAERLVADLLGPIDGPDELLQEDPATAYAVGVLYPHKVGGCPPVDEEQDFDDSTGPDALMMFLTRVSHWPIEFSHLHWGSASLWTWKFPTRLSSW